MHTFRVVIVFLLLAASATAAFVHGEIYGSDLEKLNKTALRVEGEFSYQLVTEKGNYSIFLPDGDYKISASVFDGTGELSYYTEEQIKVGAEDQRVDLVLSPVSNNYLIYLGIFLVLGITAVGLYMGKRSQPDIQEKKSEPVVPSETKKEKIEPDEDMKNVLRCLGSHEGRATQKELKEELGFSDAKLSLIISELEHSDYVKKFKRGRGNIIRKL